MGKEIDFLLAYPRPTQDSPAKLTPLSVMLPAQMLLDAGFHVKTWDQRFDPLEQFDQLVSESKTLGVSAFTGHQAGEAAELLKRAKRTNPSIITGVGGWHARVCPEEVSNEQNVDVVWPKTYGEDLFPGDPSLQHHWTRTEPQYQTSRGCPHRCGFCAISSRWIPKDLRDVEKELGAIYKLRGNTQAISFTDPDIVSCSNGVFDQETKRRMRVERINELGKIMNKLGVKWDGNIRADHLADPKLVEALAKSNCFSLEIGCESGNEEYLKKVIRKGYLNGTDDILRAVENVAKLAPNISLMCSFVAFGPGETQSMRVDTANLIDRIISLNPDTRVSVYHFAPYPGTRMYDMAIKGKGYATFKPPRTMEEWGKANFMQGPMYWITGLNFREDNTRRNFPGEEYLLIQPYVELAKEKWRRRDFDDFPIREVALLVKNQLQKHITSRTT